MAKTINIQFRLPESYTGELSDYAMGYESQAQTAKRLLMEFLDGKHSQESKPLHQAVQAPMPSDLGDFGDLESRIEELENRPALEPEDIERLAAILKRDYLPPVPDDLGDRLSALEKKAGRIGAQEQLIAMQKATTKEIYTDIKKLNDRLAKLESKVKEEAENLQYLWDSEPTEENVRKLKREFLSLKSKIEESLKLIPLDPIDTDKRLSSLEHHLKFQGGELDRLYAENRNLKNAKKTAID